MLLNHNSSFVFLFAGHKPWLKSVICHSEQSTRRRHVQRSRPYEFFTKGDGSDRKWHLTKQNHWYWIQKTSQDGIGFQLLRRKALFLSRVFSGEAGRLSWPHATFRWEHRSSHVLGRQKADLFTFLHRLGKLYCHDTVPEKLEVTGVGIFDIAHWIVHVCV